MAKITWEDEPKLLLGQFVEYAAIEYGKSTALRWAKEVQSFENCVKSFLLTFGTLSEIPQP